MAQSAHATVSTPTSARLRAAAICILTETAELAGIDPQTWLTDMLGRIADHPVKKVDELLPWNCRLLG